ncbi:hypothetical protein Efla_003660 [Eimeria flavescens]
MVEAHGGGPREDASVGEGPRGAPDQKQSFFGLPTAIRPDGRLSATALRPFKIEMGPLKGPHGSARCTQGLTVAIATVVGPLDARGAPPREAGLSVCVKQLCQPPTGPRMSVAAAAARAAAAAGEQQSVQRAAAAAAYDAGASGGPQGPLAAARKALDWGRCMEYRLQQLLQQAVLRAQFPRCLIQVVVLLQQDDGSREACCCNAAFAAVLHAGLPLRWRAWALSYVSPPPAARASEGTPGGAPQGPVYLDPTREEEAAAAKVECLITDPTTGYLVGAFSCMRINETSLEAPEALGASGVQGAPQGDLGALATAAARAVDAEARACMQQLLEAVTAAWGPLPSEDA